MNILDINAPFYSAGKKYGWEGNPVGIGIAKHLLGGEGEVEVKVGGKDTIYKIEKSKAREIVTKYQSFFKARSTLLAVVPWKDFDVK